MIIVQICVGSSCHLKGSGQIAEMLKQEIERRDLHDEVVLVGNFCIGRCNREGVTVQVDDDVFTGITKENFEKFFERNICSRVN